MHTNIDINLLTSREATISEIITDVLEVKNRPEVELDSGHEEEEFDKSTVIK